MNESLGRGSIGNLDRARRAFTCRRIEVLAGVILLLMAVNLVSVTARKSITADEVVLIPSAYYHLVTNHVQLIPQHPPLCKLLAGLPLLFIQPNKFSPAQIDPSALPPAIEWAYILRLWQDNRAHFEADARLPQPYPRLPGVARIQRAPAVGMVCAGIGSDRLCDSINWRLTCIGKF